MDKLASHAKQMLDIIDNERSFYRDDARIQADIARAVYDIIIHLQVEDAKKDGESE